MRTTHSVQRCLSTVARSIQRYVNVNVDFRKTRTCEFISRYRQQKSSSTVMTFPSIRYMTTTTITTSTTTNRIPIRDMATLEEYFLEHLGSNIQDPVLNSDLRSLDWIQRRVQQTECGNLVVTLSLPSLLHPNIEQLKEQVRKSATELVTQLYKQQGWNNNKNNHHDNQNASIPSVHVHVIPSKPFPSMSRRVQDYEKYIQSLGPGLAHISHFLAVYSCKGGVGKSTVAVNLAYELARLGGRVGLLDVDIYGPSLPVLIHPDDPAVRPSGRASMISPIRHRGVSLMSLGYVSPTSGVPGAGPQGGAAIMRGPMAGKVVAQLLKGTDWGELDVLILDLPPGTGDVQLTVCQDLQLSGAVAVTTPSKLAQSDAQKGMEMLETLGVPTLAVVDNMAFFTCEGGGRHYPFGKSEHETALSSSSNNNINVFQLPISSATNDANDGGSPLCLDRPEGASEVLSVFTSLAQAVAKELLLVQYNRSLSRDTGDADLTMQQQHHQEHRVTFPKNSNVFFDVASTYLAVNKEQHGFVARFFSEQGAIELSIEGSDLRSRDPKTGTIVVVAFVETSNGMVEHHVSPPRLFPAKVERKGRYGYAVEYADGATIIYSMFAIAKAAGGIPEER